MDYSDVFISYRRKDVAFVRQLHDALKAKGREVWVDWDDIAPGSKDFTDDIRKGIEGANAFVIVLSPDYLASQYCLNELNYAVGVNKRLLPVVYRDIPDGSAPGSVAHINWIYFCEHAGSANTLDEALPKLIEALDTDQDYVREHTDLLVRAREWDTRQRDAGFLLTEGELREVESFVAQGVSKQPRPTALHIQYIQASREAARERRAYEQNLQNESRSRLRLIIGLLVIGVALTLASLAWFYTSTTQAVNHFTQQHILSMLKTTAAGIDGDQFATLVTQAQRNSTGRSDDPRYIKHAAWLQAVHDADNQLWPYTLTGNRETGQITYIADTFAAQYPGKSAEFLQTATPGPNSPIWRGFTAPVMIADITTDQDGSWISGFAPIRNTAGRVVGVLGIDMRVDDFQALPRDVLAIAQTIGIVLACAALLGVVIFLGYRYHQQRSRTPVVPPKPGGKA